MSDLEKIKEGLESTYKKLIEYKKYKKTPLIVSKGEKIVEIPPEKITTRNNVYK